MLTTLKRLILFPLTCILLIWTGVAWLIALIFGVIGMFAFIPFGLLKMWQAEDEAKIHIRKVVKQAEDELGKAAFDSQSKTKATTKESGNA